MNKNTKWLWLLVLLAIALVFVFVTFQQEPSAPAPIAQEPSAPAPIAQEPSAPAEPPQPGVVSGILEGKYEKEGRLTLIGVEERINRKLFVLSFELPPGAYIFSPFDGFVYYYSYEGSSIKVEEEGLKFWVYSPDYDAWNREGEDGAEIKRGQIIAKTIKIVRIEIYFDSPGELFDVSLLKNFFPYI